MLMRDFYDMFERHGYAVGAIKPRGVAFLKWSYELNDFLSGPNYVAVPKDDAEMIAALRDPRSPQVD